MAVPSKRISSKFSKLSPREKLAANLAAQGLMNPEIAKKMGISPITVGVFLTGAYRKIGVSSRYELAQVLGRGTSFLRGAAKKRTIIPKRGRFKKCSCSKKLLAGWKFCPMCGKKIKS